jgi:hypothetical protein
MPSRRNRILTVGAALFLGGCASMQNVTNTVATAARSADRVIMGVSSELSGTYHSKVGDQTSLQNLRLGPADASPCLPGHREEEGRGSGLTITLTDDGRAELHREDGVVCVAPGGSSDYTRIAREAKGRYRSVGNQLWISLPGHEAELAFALDRGERTLRLVGGTGTWRMAGSRTELLAANPAELLRLMVASLESGSVEEGFETLHGSMDIVPIAAAPPIRHARLVASSIGFHEPTHVVALQADSLLDAPLAQPGDVINVFPLTGGAATSARILARHAAEGYYGCGGVLQGPSWAYLLDIDPSTLPVEEYTSEFQAIAARPTQTMAAGVAPERIRQALAPRFRNRLDEAFGRAEQHFRNGSYDGLLLTDFRRSMYGESGLGTLPEARIHALRGPSGPVYIISASMRDDPSEYKMGTTTYIWVLDSQGRVLVEAPGFRTVLLLQGPADGPQEVLMSGGVMRWDGAQPVLPPADPEYAIC